MTIAMDTVTQLIILVPTASYGSPMQTRAYSVWPIQQWHFAVLSLPTMERACK